jgi:hypothetical protein
VVNGSKTIIDCFDKLGYGIDTEYVPFQMLQTGLHEVRMAGVLRQVQQSFPKCSAQKRRTPQSVSREFAKKNYLISFTELFNPLKPSGQYMYHLL